MKCASIDIGTNTVLLMIVDMGEEIEEICDTAVITRLGEGLRETGNLTPKAMDRTLKALRCYQDFARDRGVKKIFAVGTAALREAGNRKAFVERVRKELSFSIWVISTREEAFYTYLSVRQNIAEDAGAFVIVDIGGGSTEVIWGDKKKFIDYVSLPFGSVKLTEMFVQNDPPSEKEISSLRGFIKSSLPLPFGHGTKTVIGTAGTVTTLGSISLGLARWDKRKIHGLRMNAQEIGDIVSRLTGSTVRERSEIPGMEKGREDIIPQGVIILQEILRHINAEEIIIDANGVRHGILCQQWFRLKTEA